MLRPKKMFLEKYEPKEKRLEENMDLKKSRKDFLSGKNRVLYELVKSRYVWMNRYIKDSDTCIYDIGCGIGVSKKFLKNPHVMMTDVLDHPWVDRYLDAMDLDMADGSVDVFICSNVIHHFASPYHFFQHAAKKLKGGGGSYFLSHMRAFCCEWLKVHFGWKAGMNIQTYFHQTLSAT